MGLSRKRSSGRCGECTGCKQSNCGQCRQCRDMKCFGGPGVIKKACQKRKCTHVSGEPFSTTTVSKRRYTSTLSSHVHQSGMSVYIYIAAWMVELTCIIFCLDSEQLSTQTKNWSQDEMLKVILFFLLLQIHANYNNINLLR